MKLSKDKLLLGGSLAAALAASACCVGPLVIALIGIGSAGAALALAPYRPYLLGATLLLLAGAFYLTYRRPAATCGPGGSCEAPTRGRRTKILLWAVTGLVLLAAAFPYYSAYLF